MKSYVISAFPGTGKTFAAKVSNLNVCDSDSSKFSWIYDEFGNKTDVRNPNFLKDYIDHIQNVKNALNDAGIEFISVYPDRDNKTNHINNIRSRSTGLNDDTFTSLINDNWDKWIPEKSGNNPELDSNKFNNCIVTIYLGDDVWLMSLISIIEFIVKFNKYKSAILLKDKKSNKLSFKVFDSVK